MPSSEMGMREMKCPCCNYTITFIRPARVEVNCETKQEVQIKGMFGLMIGCKNPFCGWSKVQNEV